MSLPKLISEKRNMVRLLDEKPHDGLRVYNEKVAKNNGSFPTIFG